MFQKLIAKIARVLKQHDIPYMIIGGHAVLLYGEPRMTKDIDITLGMGVGDYKKIVNVVNELSLKTLVDDPVSFVNQFMVLPVSDENGIKVDFIFSFTPYEKEAINRATKVKIEDILVNFASLEDIIIHKIFAGRARDVEDIKSILLKNKNFDKEYVIKWLTEFDNSLNENFSERFNNILKELR